MIERLILATSAGVISAGVTLLLGGSDNLAIVLAGVAALLTAIFRDLWLLFGWDD